MLCFNSRVECILVNGGLAPNVGSTYALNRLNPYCTTIVILDGVGDPLMEAVRNLRVLLTRTKDAVCHIYVCPHLSRKACPNVTGN